MKRTQVLEVFDHGNNRSDSDASRAESSATGRPTFDSENKTETSELNPYNKKAVDSEKSKKKVYNQGCKPIQDPV
jgi:hypothetical protein